MEWNKSLMTDLGSRRRHPRPRHPPTTPRSTRCLSRRRQAPRKASRCPSPTMGRHDGLDTKSFQESFAKSPFCEPFQKGFVSKLFLLAFRPLESLPGSADVRRPQWLCGALGVAEMGFLIKKMRFHFVLCLLSRNSARRKC